MFGLPSFPKLFIIAAIIAVVWYFIRRGQVARSTQNDASAPQKPGGKGASQKPIEDMVQCKSCGAYFPATSTCSCGQPQR
ncbi:hypothetical protein [Dongia sp.]|uniref:hypothetical protein n=1 Tax=Dongia sp. TaxID=1977262 RepID=UPI0035B2D0AA